MIIFFLINFNFIILFLIIIKRYVSKTEFDWIMLKRKEEEQKRREEEAA